MGVGLHQGHGLGHAARAVAVAEGPADAEGSGEDVAGSSGGEVCLEDVVDGVADVAEQRVGGGLGDVVVVAGEPADDAGHVAVGDAEADGHAVVAVGTEAVAGEGGGLQAEGEAEAAVGGEGNGFQGVEIGGDGVVEAVVVEAGVD